MTWRESVTVLIAKIQEHNIVPAAVDANGRQTTGRLPFMLQLFLPFILQAIGHPSATEVALGAVFHWHPVGCLLNGDAEAGIDRDGHLTGVTTRTTPDEKTWLHFCADVADELGLVKPSA